MVTTVAASKCWPAPRNVTSPTIIAVTLVDTVSPNCRSADRDDVHAPPTGDFTSTSWNRGHWMLSRAPAMLRMVPLEYTREEGCVPGAGAEVTLHCT